MRAPEPIVIHCRAESERHKRIHAVKAKRILQTGAGGGAVGACAGFRDPERHVRLQALHIVKPESRFPEVFTAVVVVELHNVQRRNGFGIILRINRHHIGADRYGNAVFAQCFRLFMQEFGIGVRLKLDIFGNQRRVGPGQFMRMRYILKALVLLTPELQIPARVEFLHRAKLACQMLMEFFHAGRARTAAAFR